MQGIESAARRAKYASAKLAGTSSALKNQVLLDLAEALVEHEATISEANARDVVSAREAGLPQAKVRRLTLDRAGIEQMAQGLRNIAGLADPVGAVVKEYDVPSGLKVRKVRVPLGVVMMIYEARPNVTIDAFALCFKAGNACLLKGGREANESNLALAGLVRQVLATHGLDGSCLALLTTSDREEIRHLLTFTEWIDLVIPRGGEELIRFVHEHSRIPTVQHFHGVCHIYVDEFADLDKALDICVMAKTSAPATCNAVECILVHEAVAAGFVPALVRRYRDAGVEVRADEAARQLAEGVRPAADDDWGKEFLDLIVALKVVPDAASAIQHIRLFGSHHTDAILSGDGDRQRQFLDGVDSSCVLVNASTRFNDGFQLGLGAEIGISTSKIHAYGPMGLEELTTQRYEVLGSGQAR